MVVLLRLFGAVRIIQSEQCSNSKHYADGNQGDEVNVNTVILVSMLYTSGLRMQVTKAPMCKACKGHKVNKRSNGEAMNQNIGDDPITRV